jgi:hypothetical protein
MLSHDTIRFHYLMWRSCTTSAYSRYINLPNLTKLSKLYKLYKLIRNSKPHSQWRSYSPASAALAPKPTFPIIRTRKPPSSPLTGNLANDVVDTILHTKLTGLALQMKLDSVVGAYGWKENVAKWVLEKLTRALEEGHEKLGPAVRDAYHKAVEVAMTVEGFVIEHPVFCTVVALGVLALMSPWLLPLLGFAEEGIIEGMGNLLYFRWTGTDKCYRFIRCMVAVHVRWLRPQGLTVLIPSASGYDAALA